MGLKETLDLIMQYPRIKSITVDQEGKLPGPMAIELFPAPQSQPQVQQGAMPMANDMPPDDVMMFASTPTFDEMIEKAKE